MTDSSVVGCGAMGKVDDEAVVPLMAEVTVDTLWLIGTSLSWLAPQTSVIEWSHPASHLEETIEDTENQLPIVTDDSEVETSFESSTWTLSTRIFRPNYYQRSPYVSNGYFGQALPSEGVGYWIEKSDDGGYEQNGWPLDQPRATFGTVAGFWNLQERVKYVSLPENVLRGGESVISGIPDWTGLIITTIEGESYQPGVDASTVKTYSQGMSIQNGIVHTNVTWKPTTDDVTFQLNFTVVAHRTRVNLGLVRLDLSISGPTRFRITDIIDGAGATRAVFGDKEITEDLMWTSVKPWGVENTTAYVASATTFDGLSAQEYRAVEHSCLDASDTPWVSKNLSTIARTWDLNLTHSGPRTITVYKYVGISSSDAFPKNTQSTALKTALLSKHIPWSQLITEHEAAWDETWEDADIIIPGNEELQITTRGSLFHLLTNARPGTEPHGLGDNSMMVSGLSSDSYAGLIFWDADVWMYPSLLLLHPQYAMSINNYRTRLLPQAIENAQSYNYSGLLYPWTSGRYGNCTGTGLCKDYQYHLDHDVAQAQWNWYLHTKDKSWLRERGWPIIKNAAEMFANYVVKNKETGEYETRQLGEPDEFAYNIDNGAYTNVGIKMLLGVWAPGAAAVLGEPIPRNWSMISNGMKIPYNKERNLIVEYDGMDGTVFVKQASVALINYPMGWRLNDQQAINDMEFYSQANTADGPAMTWSMYAINQAQLQEKGCAAYTYLLHGSEPYVRQPFFQFSEQATDKWNSEFFDVETSAAFPFLTGYGGYLQVFTHGFTGMRPRADGLFLDPMMVPQLPEGIKLKGIKYQGAVLDIIIELEETRVHRRSSLSADSDREQLNIYIGGKALDPGQHYLGVGETLTVPTRRPDMNGTNIPGNLALCKPVGSDEENVAGQVPLAAVDGSNATKWQPETSGPASIIIDLGRIQSASGVSINWGPIPPLSFSIGASLTKGDPVVEIFRMEDVQISAPYKAEEAKVIKVPHGNVTVASFDRGHDVRFVRFTMEGTYGDDKTVGATVAELAIIETND